MIPFNPDDLDEIQQWASRTPTTTAHVVAYGSEAEWLDARRLCIGASEIGAIVGMSSWTSPYALWWRKKLDWRLPTTVGQRWGHLVEDPIAQLFAEAHEDTLRVYKPYGAPFALYADPVHPWMVCTPDRFAVDKAGSMYPVEIKSDEGGKGWGKSGGDQIPDMYRAQGMWQAHILGCTGFYIARKGGHRRFAWYWIPYDEDFIAGLIMSGLDFLKSIADGREPEPDGSKATTDALQERFPGVQADTEVEVAKDLREDWRAARDAKRLFTKLEAEASNRLRAAMGDAEYATHDGTRFARRSIGKRIGYEVPPGQTDQLREIHDDAERTPPRDLRGEADSEAASSHRQEGAGDGGDPGTGLGDRPDSEKAGGPAASVALTCPGCGMTSHNPNDAAQGYCGNCHVFISDLPDELRALVETLPGTRFNLADVQRILRAQAGKEPNN